MVTSQAPPVNSASNCTPATVRPAQSTSMGMSYCRPPQESQPQFMEWMQSGLVQRARYSRYMFAIHHEVLQRLFEAALRLKMNMFTWYFM